VRPDIAVSARASPWTVFGLVAVAVFLVSLDATIVLAAFPALRHAFPAVAPATLSWVLNAYTIVYAALLVPAGRFADTHRRRRVFLGGVALFGLASALSGVAPDPASLIAFRVMQAVGAAALTPASLALILAAFPPQKRAVAVGLWGAVGALAAAFGPAVGGWLVQLAGWQSVFLVNVPVVALALWRGASRLDESRSPEPATHTDMPGVALLIAAIGGIVLGLVHVVSRMNGSSAADMRSSWAGRS
jgi:MFS family permease